jgi:DUF917 family protein
VGIRIDKDTLEAAVLGGTVLGGGGGGWIDEGTRLGRLALERGFSEILSIDEFPADALLLTVSAVGAPSAGKDAVAPDDYVRAVELFIEKSQLKIDGLISSEIGAVGVVNGWLQSAAMSIPVADAPCNGRAHPLALMGSMDLGREAGYASLQAAVGRTGKGGNRIETFLNGPLEEVSGLIREISTQAGGMVAVARNPVPAQYVRGNGAPGAIDMAVRIGRVMMAYGDDGPQAAVERVLETLGGKFYLGGFIENVDLKTEAGLDIGLVRIKSEGRSVELCFWNEYMTLEIDGARLAVFPDLIMTFEAGSAKPLISAEIQEGQEIIAIASPREKLILGAGMRDAGLLQRIERAIGKEIIKAPNLR